MKPTASAVIGKWRIFEADLWTANDLDHVEPAYIRFDSDGRGEFMFICVTGTMACGFGRQSADLTWQGFDEMDETSGSGDADLEMILTIEIKFHHGDEAVLKAKRW